MQAGYNNIDNYIVLENVDFSYQKSELILKNIAVHFKRAEFAAITGLNGSGKTTLGKLMTGILKPDRGRVLVDGQDTAEISLGQLGKKVGYLFQQPERQLFNPTVREEIAFAPTFADQKTEDTAEKVTELISLFSLQGLEDSSPYKLSRGEKQRLALAAILINEPSFLILDEPTTGLDVVRKNQLSELLKELQSRGIGLAVISHDNDFVSKNADRVIEIAGGELIEI